MDSIWKFQLWLGINKKGSVHKDFKSNQIDIVSNKRRLGMHEYLLVQNLMYDIKHVRKRRFWHKIFGNPKLTVDVVKASTSIEAIVIFKKRGNHFGCFN